MSLSTEIKRTALYEEHILLNAKMIPFGGWEMPVQYQGILSEYNDARQKVSLFDTSHMGEFIIDGDAVLSGLDNIVTQSIEDMPVKTCRYGVALNNKGKVIDDLIVYRIEEEKWMIVVNGGTIDKDAQHFISNITKKGQFTNISSFFGKLDVQGPLSRDLLKPLIKDIEKLSYYAFDIFEIFGKKVIVSRTGYTGELGYEIYFPLDGISDLWREILTLGAKPAGLGVRDLLRIEMCYSLYGHEISEDISPLDAGLNRFIEWEKEFIGKQSLQACRNDGIENKLVAFVSETRRSPRSEHKIFSEGGEDVGVVTSGTYSPSLEKGIGLGFIKKDYGDIGNKILIGDNKNKFAAKIEKKPIYAKGTFRKD